MEILVPIAFFAMIAAVVIVPRYFRSVERQKVADTLRVAIEKGQPLPQEVVEAMSSNVRSAPQTAPSPQRDLRTGIIWLGVGLGIAALGLALSWEEADATMPLLGIAAFPTFIGLAFIALSYLNKPKG